MQTAKNRNGTVVSAWTAGGVMIGEGTTMIWNIKQRNKALGVMLAACSAFLPLGEAQCAPVPAVPYECPERDGQVFYQNSGLRFFVPKELDSLLLTETPRKTGNGRLFSVSEKASVEAAEALGWETDGAGWLFAIGWIEEPDCRRMLCGDMSGAEIFAKDKLGNRYIFYHPTDVRYARENAEAMKRDSDQWTALNQWAWQSVRKNFLKDNRRLGLQAETFDNSTVGICMARVAYDPETKFTISANGRDTLRPEGADSADYAERLVRNVEYRAVELEEMPEGDYVSLDFPEEHIRLDFFRKKGAENYVRELQPDGRKTFYQAFFADGKTKAGTIAYQWYRELKRNRK